MSPLEPNIKIGPVRFTLSVSVGFVALGFVWACIANLGQLLTPSALTTLSFWVMVVAGIWLFHDLGTRFESVLDRMFSRGAFALSEEELDQFKADIQRKSQMAALVGGVVLFLLMVAFYVSAYKPEDGIPSASVLIQYFFEAGANFIVGIYMGRTVIHSSIGILLQKRRVHIAIMRGHPDGAAGMSPIGGLFLRQAAVMLMPAFYFVLWWALMTSDGIGEAKFFDEEVWTQFCQRWADTYFTLFVVMIAIELVAFFGPMWVFHLQMVRQKAQQQMFADDLSNRMNAMRSQLENETDEEKTKAIKDQIAHMTELYEEIESLPSWPLSTAVRRKFAIRNTIVMLPVLIKIYEFFSKQFFSGS